MPHRSSPQQRDRQVGPDYPLQNKLSVRLNRLAGSSPPLNMRCSISARVAPIVSIIADISAPVANVTTELSAVSTKLTRIGADLAGVSTQFLPRCIFAPILTVLAHVRPSLAPVAGDWISVPLWWSLSYHFHHRVTEATQRDTEKNKNQDTDGLRVERGQRR